MKILSIHTDKKRYRAKMKTRIAEPNDKREDSMEQYMVFFSCVEKQDESNPEGVVEGVKESIIKRLDQVKVKDMMIFPYAHLAPALSSPEVALRILKELESALAEEGYNVKRAPFGWYKEFELKVKGHPMAEQLLSISLNEREQEDIFCPHCCNPIKAAELSRR